MLTMAILDVKVLAVHLFAEWFEFISLVEPTYMVQEVGSLKGEGRCRRVESCKIVFLGGTSYSLAQILFAVGCIV